MKLSKENKKIIETEFDFVINKMANSKSPDELLYYFTGIYTMLQRILNLEFSRDLLLTHFILEKSYVDIMARLKVIKSGQNVVVFHEDFGSKLLEYTKELKKGFNNSEQRMDVLKNIVVLSYTTVGNGYYLSQKKIIDIYPNKNLIENE